MRSKMLRKSVYIPLLALGLTSVAPAAMIVKASPAAESNVNFETEASRLLKEVKRLSADLKADGVRIEALALHKKRPSSHTHGYELTEARTHINAIGQRLHRLQAIEPATAAWQQKAIAEIVPIAAEVAAHTEAAIQHLNDNRGHLFSPVYKDHLAEIAQQSNELKSKVDAYTEFASVSDKHQKLGQQLDQLSDELNMTES